MGAFRSSRFDKLLKEIDPETRKTFEAKLSLLEIDPRHPSLRNQKLCKIHWRIWIDTSHRLIFLADPSGTPTELLWIGHKNAYEKWMRNNC